MKRRGFLQTLASMPLLLSVNAPMAGARSRLLGASNEQLRAEVLNHPLFQKNQAAILQGMTNETSAEFTVLRRKSLKWNYQVRQSDGTKIPVADMKETSRAHSDWVLDRFTVRALSLGENYLLRVLDDETGGAVDERSFSALNRDSNQIRFAMVSCMNDEHHASQMAVWSSLISQNPQMIFFVGDTCYADKGAGQDENAIWDKSVETRRLLKIFRSDRLIPSLAVWDDHDFGLNDGDGRYPLKTKTKKIFNAFFGSAETEGLRHGPGVSKVFEGFGQRFFMMDDRYFREPKFSGGTLWGSEQEDWLIRELERESRPTWIMNGGQFFGGYHMKDSYEFAHGKSFWPMMKRIRDTGNPVVLGSGDVHYSEIMAVEPEVFGFPTFEITSSSMHSSTFPMKDKLLYNRRRLCSAWRHNFTIVESRAVASGFDLRVRSHSAGGVLNFSRSLQVRCAT